MAGKPCPFCAQDLRGSTMIAHYRAYFGDAYEGPKRDVADAISALDLAHGGDAPAAFERSIRTTSERRQFWSAFWDMPTVDLQTADIARIWATARDAVRAALVSKRDAPLEWQTLPAEARAAVDAYELARTDVAALSQRLQQANEAVLLVKEQAASGNIATLEADVADVKAVKTRHSQNVAPLATGISRKRQRRPPRRGCATRRAPPSPSIARTSFQPTRRRLVTIFACSTRASALTRSRRRTFVAARPRPTTSW